MRSFFANIKIIIGELIGLFGGFFWARSTNWDYEPLILFSISGVGLFISILSLIFKKKNAEQNTLLISEQIVNQINNVKSENTNLNITNISPQNIKKQIQTAPLFQQNDIAKHFIGLNILWSLKLFMIHKVKDNKIIVSMKPLDNTYVNIKFETDTEKYPIFKIAEDNKILEITGKIINCKEFDIELELISLKEK